jgi:hypothetical protein
VTLVRYQSKAFKPETLAIIRSASDICEEYHAQGYDLTLRQLFYQFVARGLIPNTQASYNRLGEIINGARMAGMLSWEYIVDRTRNLKAPPHWGSPAEILLGASYSYARDKWAGQPSRVEVWVEKEALAGVVERAATALDCPHFSCRGYVSQSEMWRAARRIGGHLATTGVERVVVLHLGDHDPSGIDMTRDIKDRLGHFIGVDHAQSLFAEMEGRGVSREAIRGAARAGMQEELQEYMDRLEVRRIALNMDQVREHDPPPNPAKMTDARATGYVGRYGRQSWELDALPPDVLDDLIRQEIEGEIEWGTFERERAKEEDEKKRLRELARGWERRPDL